MRQSFVKKWMTSPVITVSPETDLSEARRIIDEKHIRALPVMQNGKLVGLINRQVLMRLDLSILGNEAWNLGIFVANNIASDVMKTDLTTISPDASIPEASTIMLKNKINALPVIEKDELIGILTSSDLLRFILSEYPGLNKKITVADYMTDEVITINRDTTLLEAHNLMGTKHIRSLPVIENGMIAGLVTRTDLMSSDPTQPGLESNQETTQKVLAQPVEKVMTFPILTMTADSELTEAAKIMLQKKIHCLPVVDAKNSLVGIITESDLFLMVVQKFS